MIGAAIQKDVALLLRDRGALASLFLLPIIFIVAFGSMFRFGPDRGKPRPIAIWHAPGDARGEAIARAVGSLDGFAPVAATSDADARQRVVDQTADAALVIPGAGPIELAIDLASPLQVRGPIQGALTAAVMRATAPPGLDRMPTLVLPRSPPGIRHPLQNISAFQVTVPGNAVLFGFFIALTTAMAFVGERRTGTWRRLLAAPVPRSTALLATLVPYYVIGVIQLAFLFGVGALGFGMKVAGSIPALIVLSLSVSLCAVCLGLLFAAVATSEKQLGGIGSIVLLVMGLLGGCMMPRLIMPEVMRAIGLAVPHGWALEGYYDLLVREGSTLGDVLPSIGAMLGFATVFAGLGLWRFRFER